MLMSNISAKDVAKLILENDDILIISHKSPDGDTLGCAFSLYYSLCQLGKNARIECSDEFPKKYDYLYKEYSPKEFEPKFIVAVDIADVQLFGKKTEKYSKYIDICIDHHPSNTHYANKTLLNSSAAAACEVMYEVLTELGVTIDKNIANSIYTGVLTDTGCFKYSNTSAITHIIAARMIEAGADYAEINKDLFDTKSKSRLLLEKEVINNLKYYFDDKCAVINISQELLEKTGANEFEIDGLSALPRQIEGVEVGITLREKEDGYKISLRTTSYVNACEICKALGGGGHARAAGCFIEGDLETVTKTIIEEVRKHF